MRMPEPEEDKVTVTGRGLRASGLLKLGSVRRSLLKKGLFVLQSSTSSLGHFAIATTLYQLRFSNNPHNTPWFTLGSHVRTPVGVVNSPLVSARSSRPHCACLCLVNVMYKVLARGRSSKYIPVSVLYHHINQSRFSFTQCYFIQIIHL